MSLSANSARFRAFTLLAFAVLLAGTTAQWSEDCGHDSLGDGTFSFDCSDVPAAQSECEETTVFEDIGEWYVIDLYDLPNTPCCRDYWTTARGVDAPNYIQCVTQYCFVEGLSDRDLNDLVPELGGVIEECDELQMPEWWVDECAPEQLGEWELECEGDSQESCEALDVFEGIGEWYTIRRSDIPDVECCREAWEVGSANPTDGILVCDDDWCFAEGLSDREMIQEIPEMREVVASCGQEGDDDGEGLNPLYLGAAGAAAFVLGLGCFVARANANANLDGKSETLMSQESDHSRSKGSISGDMMTQASDASRPKY